MTETERVGPLALQWVWCGLSVGFMAGSGCQEAGKMCWACQLSWPGLYDLSKRMTQSDLYSTLLSTPSSAMPPPNIYGDHVRELTKVIGVMRGQRPKGPEPS